MALEALVARQAAEIQRLEGIVAEQAAELQRLRSGRGPRKTPQNSSLPPSSATPPSQPKAPSPGKPRGARRGHLGRGRHRCQPDRLVERRPERCAGCGGDLLGVAGQVKGRSQQIELPPLRPVVIELVRYTCRCPGCGARNVADYPAGWDPHQRLGPRLQATLAYLHHHHHVGYERLRLLLWDLCGLRLSEGAMANALARTATRLKAAAQQIREQVRGSRVVGSDETRQRVDGQTRWSWVVQSQGAAYHWVGESRGTQELTDFFGERVPEVQECDLFSAQLASPVPRKAVCHAHQLRDLRYAQEQGDGHYSPRMARLIRLGLHLAKRRAELTPHRYEHQAARVRRLAHQLAFGPLVKHWAGVAMQRRYRRLEAHWWTFLERADVAPTNNASERALRPVVVHRKVTGGFRSEWGAHAYAAFASVAQTAPKEGRPIFEALLEILMPHDWLALSSTPSA